MDTSFVKMSKEEVKKLCEQTLKHIKEEREKRDKEWEETSWLKRLFSEHKIYPSIYGWWSEDVANRLLLACEKSYDGLVLVSTKDLEEIK